MATPVSALDVLDLAGTVAPPSGVGRYVSIGGVPYYLAPLSTNPTALGSGGSGTVNTDATMTGDGSSGNPLHVVTQFGADTTIQQLNSASALKTTWEGISAYTSNTSGAEASNYVIKVLTGGAQVVAQTIGPGGTIFPAGTPSVPGVALGSNSYGLSADSVTNHVINFTVAGSSFTSVNQFGIASNAFYFGNSVNGPWLQSIQSADAVSFNPTINLKTGSQYQDFVIGAGAALATTAAAGFLQVSTMAGAPTGSAHLATGAAALVYDTTNSKLWISSTAGTWKGIVLS